MTISPSYPDILTNGAPADATQVMANFYQIQNDVNANAAHNGANSDITSLLGLTTPLAVALGGTGVTSLSALLSALGAAPLNAPSFTGGVTVAGGTATDTLAASGAATLSSTLAVGGAATLSNTLAVSGAASLNGGGTSITPSINDQSTKIATTAFVNPGFSLGTPGYIKLATGVIIQWGRVTTSTSGNTVTFPVSFPSALWVLVAGADNVIIPANSYVAVQNYNNAQFNISTNNGTPSANWIAIGI